MNKAINKCTFPDLSEVEVVVKKKQQTQTLVSWTFPGGLYVEVWVPSIWVS
jgi:hypothetical protein